MTMTQRSQNKMLRILDGALVSDRKSTKSTPCNLTQFNTMFTFTFIHLQMFYVPTSDLQFRLQANYRHKNFQSKYLTAINNCQ